MYTRTDCFCLAVNCILLSWAFQSRMLADLTYVTAVYQPPESRRTVLRQNPGCCYSVGETLERSTLAVSSMKAEQPDGGGCRFGFEEGLAGEVPRLFCPRISRLALRHSAARCAERGSSAELPTKCAFHCHRHIAWHRQPFIRSHAISALTSVSTQHRLLTELTRQTISRHHD